MAFKNMEGKTMEGGTYSFRCVLGKVVQSGDYIAHADVELRSLAYYICLVMMESWAMALAACELCAKWVKYLQQRIASCYKYSQLCIICA